MGLKGAAFGFQAFVFAFNLSGCFYGTADALACDWLAAAGSAGLSFACCWSFCFYVLCVLVLCCWLLPLLVLPTAEDERDCSKGFAFTFRLSP